jgi:hypothetical protein
MIQFKREMIDLKLFKKHLSSKNITFLVDFDKTINIDKTGKYYYYKIYMGSSDGIDNFLINLKDDEIYLVNPLISIKCRYNEPYLTLSRQFLISNESKPALIHRYLSNKLNQAEEDFEFDIDNFFLILKYKSVKLDYRIFEDKK